MTPALGSSLLQAARAAVARARERFAKAKTPDQRDAVEATLRVAQALEADVAAEPDHQGRIAAAFAGVQRDIAHLLRAVGAQDERLQRLEASVRQLSTGLQRLSAASSAIGQALEAEKKSRASDRAAAKDFRAARQMLDAVRADPHTSALQLLANNQREDREKAAKQSESKRIKIERELEVLERVKLDALAKYQAETNDSTRAARARALSPLIDKIADKRAALEELAEARPH